MLLVLFAILFGALWGGDWFYPKWVQILLVLCLLFGYALLNFDRFKVELKMGLHAALFEIARKLRAIDFVDDPVERIEEREKLANSFVNSKHGRPIRAITNYHLFDDVIPRVFRRLFGGDR